MGSPRPAARGLTADPVMFSRGCYLGPSGSHACAVGGMSGPLRFRPLMPGTPRDKDEKTQPLPAGGRLHPEV